MGSKLQQMSFGPEVSFYLSYLSKRIGTVEPYYSTHLSFLRHHGDHFAVLSLSGIFQVILKSLAPPVSKWVCLLFPMSGLKNSPFGKRLRASHREPASITAAATDDDLAGSRTTRSQLHLLTQYSASHPHLLCLWIPVPLSTPARRRLLFTYNIKPRNPTRRLDTPTDEA